MIDLKQYCMSTIERTLSMMRTAKFIDQSAVLAINKLLREKIKEQEGKK